MLYFMTEKESEDKYFGMYQQAIRDQLARRRVQFEEISLDRPREDALKEIESISAAADDVWLLSYAHNPIARRISRKNGTMYGHVHGLGASIFEPARLLGYDLNERDIFGLYDHIFVNSQWAESLIERAYPDIPCWVTVSGFPFDAEKLHRRRCEKRENMIVFNQRFSLDKLHILEVHLADILTGLGYHVVHLLPESEYDECLQRRHRRVLLQEAQKRGLQFIVNSSKEEYYRRLARATAMITTPLAETLSVATLEAAALQVRPIVPDFGPFPEFVPISDRYQPYSIEGILQTLFSSSRGQVKMDKFHPRTVVGIYLREMGI